MQRGQAWLLQTAVQLLKRWIRFFGTGNSTTNETKHTKTQEKNLYAIRTNIVSI